MDKEMSEMKLPDDRARFSFVKLFGIILIATFAAVFLALWAAKIYLFPTEFKPVTLNAQEERLLNQKIDQLESRPNTSASSIEPEPYTENMEKREITITEKELNALIAKNTDLATKLAIDLSENLASAKLLIDLDEGFPVFGGKTLKVTAGMIFDYRDETPAISLKGVSVWGVPLPNAWLGHMKNVDLVEEYGLEAGFWSNLADGISHIKISDGRLRIKLKP